MPFADCGFEAADGLSGSDRLVVHGPTIFVRIGFDREFLPSRRRLPDLPPRLFPALIDTGATQSSVDSALAADLDLPVVDHTIVSGTHGADDVDVHMAQILVPALGVSIYGSFAAVHLSAGGQQHRALIGRTFLRHYAMIYDGRAGAVRLVSDPP